MTEVPLRYETAVAVVTSPTIRILIAGIGTSDADLIAARLERSGQLAILERADSADAFARRLRDFKPDVVLCDHASPEFGAPDALKLLRAAKSTAPLIIVAKVFDEQLTVRSLRAGAEDFVLKDNLSRLPAAIAAALHSRRQLERLSPRQREVLRLVAEGHTTREIARELQLSAKTIETHRGAIMKRLEIHDLVGLVRYALRVGLVSSDT